ncbi:MAG: 2-C-methyl-D-erythritol 2,4-cyclodiphosphate synthase [Bacteroidia bacterium]|nr:2-C-methyl-D-erythritol 2,4-cyclodiphosphate synthase [Bacteroidia bacterium]
MKPNFRIGFGFDVHQLQAGKEFWLGGIQIGHTKGAVGHSDADVLIHAICDALLGAAGLRDIGFYFPNTDAKYKGIDSKKLLAEVMRLLTENNFKVGNVDCTLCAEAPKINPHINKMKEVLSPIMGIEISDLSIKATTNEQMGFIGREEGVAAYAVALIYK